MLGFGVSGDAQPGLLTPLFRIEKDWLTGGAFGLEGSLPGLITVVALLAVFADTWRTKPAEADGSISRITP